MARDSRRKKIIIIVSLKFELDKLIETLTINKIAIVIENRDLSERLLLKVFWFSILLLRQVDGDNFIWEVFLLQNGCNALCASRSCKLDSKYVKFVGPGSVM